MNRAIRIWFAILTGLLLRSLCFAQDSESRVFFLGIGVDKCVTTSGDTARQPNAVADLQLIMKRTQLDAMQARSVNFNSGGRNMMIRKFTPHLLLNNKATKRNIDSVMTIIVAQAQPTDVFYICISAPDSADNFYIYGTPDNTAKKTKPKDARASCLFLNDLKMMCGQVRCINQLIVANSDNWKEHENHVTSSVFRSPLEQRNQVIVYPSQSCTDSFLIAGKNVSCFAGGIYNCTSRSLLEVFLLDNENCEEIAYEMNSAFRLLTGMSGRYYFFNASWNTDEWKLAHSMIAVQPAVPAPKLDDVKTPEPKTRGVVEDPSAEEETAMIAAEEVNNYALIIANQNYQRWDKLYTPIADGMELEKELREHYGYETRLLINVALDSLNKEFKALAARKFDSKSQVLVYFAGHGGYDEDLGEGYLVPVDADDPHSASIMSDVISYGFLLKILDNLDAQHVLVMLDACYSGAFNPSISGKKACPRRSGQAMQSLGMMVNNSMNMRSRCYITSGMLNTVPDGTKHTPFNDAVMNTLRSKWERNEVVFFEDLIVAVKRLPSKPQDGVFGQNADGDTGEYFFFPSKLLSKK